MNSFVYQEGNSVLHRVDAVMKFIWLLLVTITAVMLTTPIESFLLFMWVWICGLLLGKLTIQSIAKRLIPIGLVALWLLLFYSFGSEFTDSTTIEIGFLKATNKGINYGLTLALRVLTLCTASTILILTTNPRIMVAEFVKFGHLPYRAGFAIYAALRFLPLLENEARIIRHAHAVRADTSGRRGIAGRIELVRRLAIPLLAGSLRRVQTMAVAMDARGFGAYSSRTEIDELKRDKAGMLFTGLQLIILILFIVWKSILYGPDLNGSAPIIGH
jgi:energy-coupling factor transport system permease protein